MGEEGKLGEQRQQQQQPAAKRKGRISNENTMSLPSVTVAASQPRIGQWRLQRNTRLGEELVQG